MVTYWVVVRLSRKAPEQPHMACRRLTAPDGPTGAGGPINGRLRPEKPPTVGLRPPQARQELYFPMYCSRARLTKKRSPVRPQDVPVAVKQEAAQIALTLREAGMSFMAIAAALERDHHACCSVGWVYKVCKTGVVPRSQGRPPAMTPELMGCLKALADVRADVGAGMSRMDMAEAIAQIFQTQYNLAADNGLMDTAEAMLRHPAIKAMVDPDGTVPRRPASKVVVNTLMKHTGMKCRTVNQSTAARIRAVRNRASIAAFHAAAVALFEELGIVDPTQLYDLDETNFQAVEGQLGKCKVISSRDEPGGRATAGSRDSFTVLPITSAGGEDPCGDIAVITASESMTEPFGPMRPQDLPNDADNLFVSPTGRKLAAFYSTKTGHNSKALFEEFLRTRVVDWIRGRVRRGQWAVIFMDRASTHMVSKEFDAWLKSKKIMLFYFPPKMTALLQPLDVRTFRDVKHFKSMLVLRTSPGLAAAGRSISLTGGIKMASLAMTYAFRGNGEHIRKSFVDAGLWPLSKEVMLRMAPRARGHPETVEEATTMLVGELHEDARRTAQAIHANHSATPVRTVPCVSQADLDAAATSIFDATSVMHEIMSEAEDMVKRKDILAYIQSLGAGANTREGIDKVKQFVSARKNQAKTEELAKQAERRAKEGQRRAKLAEAESRRKEKDAKKNQELKVANAKVRRLTLDLREALRGQSAQGKRTPGKNSTLGGRGRAGAVSARARAAARKRPPSRPPAPRGRRTAVRMEAVAGSGARRSKRTRSPARPRVAPEAAEPACDDLGFVWEGPVQVRSSRRPRVRRT